MSLPIRLLMSALSFLLVFPQLRAEESVETARRVDRAIAELDSDDYAVRAAATQTLKQIGRPAIAPLTHAALHGELETTDRALQILISFNRLEDAAALDELDTALEKLADSDRPSAARRAASAIKIHAAGREQRALEKLAQLNAIIRPATRIGDMSPDDLTGPLHVWIDEQWKGGDTELKLFRRVNRIDQLYRVEGCPASLEAVRKLDQIIPDLHVQERGAAFLGLVAGEPQAKGFQIQKVSEGGSIEAAGLRVNDVIIGYRDKQVDNFDQLVEMIKENKVGDTVKVDFLRAGVPQTVDVKLKSWREVFDEEKKLKRRSPDPPQPPPPSIKPKPAK